MHSRSAKRSATAIVDHAVLTASAQEQLARLVLHGLEHREARGQTQPVRLDRAQADAAGDPARDSRREQRRLAQRHDAIHQHVAALAVDQRDRKTLFDILARDHLVDARLGEQLRPALQRAIVERIVVGAIQIGQTRPQLQPDRHAGRHGDHAGYSSITER